nr:polyprenyl diphosphate synthase [uncultured Caldimonas sp.]
MTEPQLPVPQHIAVIMDGNRRWARQRFMPTALGHATGAKRVRGIVRNCSDRGVRFLTLFAFSTENWGRPADEVSSLMELFVRYLRSEIDSMSSANIRLKVVGDFARFNPLLRRLISEAQGKTAENTGMTLTIAANYGGRWDMVQAMQAWQSANPGLPLSEANEHALSPYLATSYAPDPDLLIRTGGESRISNFLLWQMAYTELYFTPTLWPDFSAAELDAALAWYAGRDRRFGACSSSPGLRLAAVG